MDKIYGTVLRIDWQSRQLTLRQMNPNNAPGRRIVLCLDPLPEDCITDRAVDDDHRHAFVGRAGRYLGQFVAVTGEWVVGGSTFELHSIETPEEQAAMQKAIDEAEPIPWMDVKSEE